MKLSKRKSAEGGYTISCKVGNRVYRSWWSGPPESVDHVGIEYLKGRYPVITTKKRADTFKQLYKQLWQVS